MLESRAESGPFWEQSLPEEEYLAQQVEHEREAHLSSDPRPPAENNEIVLTAMQYTGPKFWLTVTFAFLLQRVFAP